ncbi:phage tail protein [Kosakonia pseudosacchari]|uniref:phage tail protein n=1 Tax=Kosakonia pseudosacchari TaxID=1646340 RepID=UPI000A3B13E1|nr:phage tail protein [Kosakonia pseudosacchari]
MTAKYYAILTNQGAAKLATATALGTQIHITQMAVGDGNGSLPTPDATQTQLLNQKRIGAVNTLTVDAANTNQIIAEQVIPENEGGYWIREMGLFDDEGVLIAVANCPETYKPLLQEGSGRTQTIRMALIVSSTAAVTLKIDPSLVLATRKYVDDKIIEVKAYSDDLLKQHVAAANPHAQYLQLSDIAKFTPVGVPQPYPAATPPIGWLKCNGAEFDKAKYPGLAALFPSGYLPDLPGEFIRGWDDGRGVDAGRALLLPQEDAIQNIVGTFGRTQLFQDSTLSGAFRQTGSSLLSVGLAPAPSNATGYGASNWSFDASRAVRTATETRPHNIAFNYIVRAA